MNKLMGFFELKDLNLPTIPWKEYKKGMKLDSSLLWTVRSAVYRGMILIYQEELELLQKKLKNLHMKL